MIVGVACASVISANAMAASVTYKFVGVVTGTSSTCPVAMGKKASITLTLTRPSPGQKTSKTTKTYGTEDNGPITAATFDRIADSISVNNVTISKASDGSSIVLNTADPNEGPSLSLRFASSLSSAVANFAIPGTIRPGNFQTATFQWDSGAPNFFSCDGTL